MTDERAGKPSASGFERLKLCPGSWNLERTQPPQPPGPDAEMGTRIHRALADARMADGLTEDECKIWLRCAQLATETCQSLLGVPLSECVVHRDCERLWLLDDEVQRVISGLPDVVAIYGEAAWVCDYKTGRNEVAPGPDNLQLMVLALLVSRNYNVSTVYVSLIHPWSDTPVTTAVYQERELELARTLVLSTIAEAQKADAPRRPGSPQCDYCRAKAVCHEARNLTTTLVPTDRIALPLEASEVADWLRKVSVVEDIIAAVKASVKERLQSGENIPGVRLKPGAVKQTITDPQQVFARACALGVPTVDFLSAVTVGKSKLQNSVRSATGQRGKALEATMEELLAGCVEEKQNAPSLEVV